MLDITKILNGENAEISIKEVRFSKLNTTVYFFIFNNGVQKGNYMKSIVPFQDRTEWELNDYNSLRCGYMISDSNAITDIVYFSDKLHTFYDRNGYELKFE